jgi:membrane-associated phospholipid phosphatase
MSMRLKKYPIFLFFLLQIALIGTCINTAHAQFAKIQELDDRIMIDLAEHRTPEKTGFFMFMSNTYKYGNVGVPAALLAGGIIANDKEMRPRPFIQNIKIVPVYRAGSYSFPSGHTSSTFTTATALSIAYPKWYVIAPAFLWAGTVGYSRMYLGVHYPTDVATGAILGTGTAAAMSFLKR